MIIDMHVHIGASKVFGKGGFADPRKIVELMDQHKIDMAALIPTASPPKPRYYEDVQAALKEFPDRFYGFFLANPKEENVCDMLEMAVDKFGFVGVKMHPTFLAVPADDHDLVYPIMEKVKELKICAMIHSDPFLYGTPWQIGLLAMDFPEVPVVMAHMGMVSIVYIDAAINMAKRAPNLYLDTTGISAEAKIATAKREIGISRILYGSDAPFRNPAYEMSKIHYVEISEEDKKLILGENARRLLEPLRRK
jgi:predicted TIM-barrel fold metal-dependent hydrolase